MTKLDIKRKLQRLSEMQVTLQGSLTQIKIDNLIERLEKIETCICESCNQKDVKLKYAKLRGEHLCITCYDVYVLERN